MALVKVSRYIITQLFHDQVARANMVLVYSTLTGKLFNFSLAKWQELISGNGSSFSEHELLELRKSCLLVDEHKSELDELLLQNKSSRAKDFLYYVLQPTAWCPLNCFYCGQKHEKHKYNVQLCDLLLAELKELFSSGKYKAFKVCWFGGEPLSAIKIIKKLSKELISLCNDYNIAYKSMIITSGFLLNKNNIKTLMVDCKVDKFEITVDGLADVHDSRRVLKSGKGTFHKIYANINLLARTKANISIRCNLDDSNLAQAEPLIYKLYSDGLSTRVSLYFARIHSWGNRADLLVKSQSDWATREIELLQIMHEYGFNINLLPNRKYSTCLYTDENSLMIDPYGNKFKCTELSLVSSYKTPSVKVGDLYDHNSINSNQFGDFYDKAALKKYGCSKCPLLPVCGGGCPKEWHEGRIPCPSFKYNFKQRMLLSFLIFKQNNKSQAKSYT